MGNEPILIFTSLIIEYRSRSLERLWGFSFLKNRNMTATPPDMTPTLENLKRELANTGLKAEIKNGYVCCTFTPTKPKIGATIAALSIRFEKRLAERNHNLKGVEIKFAL